VSGAVVDQCTWTTYTTLAAENDWQVRQHLPHDGPSVETSLQKYYGFLDTHHGYFRHVTHTENEINELGDKAENLPPSERRKLRIQHENDKWDEEYYMCVLVFVAHPKR
jgi:protein SHQ1